MLDFLWACLHKPVLWQGCVGREAVESSDLSMVSLCVHTDIYTCMHVLCVFV